MMKKIFVLLMAGVLMVSTFAFAQKGRSEQGSQPVTHPQLAELMVRALGLVSFLPTGATPQQMFDVLMQNGIAPEEGWKLDAVLNKADLARVLVQTMRLQDEVENPMDPQSWIETLRANGVSIDRLSATIQIVEVLPDRLSQNVTAQSTDPLVYGINFVPGGTDQYSVPLELATRVLSEVEIVAGEFRPVRPTPH